MINHTKGDLHMKLIALDLDGTLLSSKNEISAENVGAIKEAQQKGHIVMICSGRAPESVQAVLDKAGIDCPFAASNGSVAVAEGKKIHEVSMDTSTLLKTLAILDEQHLPYRVYTNQGIYVPSSWDSRVTSLLQSSDFPDHYRHDEHFDRMLEHPKGFEQVTPFSEPSFFSNHSSLTVQKMFILAFSPVQKEKLRAQLEKMNTLGITSSASFNLEVMSPNGHKGTGISVMANHFGIPMEHTVAIGDNYNDVPMFEVAGLSIAMGNGEKDIQEMCDVVTKTEDEHGVAYALNHLI